MDAPYPRMQRGAWRVLALLEVDNLTIGFGTAAAVVDTVGFRVEAGETLALVGESGSGKTLSCRAALGLLPKAAQVRGGSVRYSGKAGMLDILRLPPRRLCAIRGAALSMIFQEPMRSLSPLHRIGNQVVEVLRLHGLERGAAARQRVLETFAQVGFDKPERVWQSYPFELSGGMRQRAMIAMAIVARPELLIADEPTTALDVTTQAQVLGLIRDIQKETGMAVMLVTHDLGVVANMAHRVVVMNRGRVVEAGCAADVLRTPWHAYTKTLFAAAPKIPAAGADPGPIDARPAKTAAPPARDLILEMHDIRKTFTLKGAAPWARKISIHALRGAQIEVERGKITAVVGESGSGKTTCARIALGAMTADPGATILFRPEPQAPPIDLQSLSRAQRLAFQRQAQMVFQDPYSTLNPRMRIEKTLTEPLEIHRIGTPAERRDRAAAVLEWVGLSPDMLERFPHAFSGGQRQRLSIARALMLDPVFLVCDEPTSALDVSVQEQILHLLEDIRDRFNLSYLFISHDLAVVARLADEVVVMRRGWVVEQGTPEALFLNPQHPYTKALIAAHPEPSLDRLIDLALVAQGAGAPSTWPDAYRMRTIDHPPPLREVADGHRVRCHA